MIDIIAAHAGKVVLVSFFLAFVGIAFWAYRPRNRARLEAHRNIPLQEG